jgi:hypothetical protein
VWQRETNKEVLEIGFTASYRELIKQGMEFGG